MPNLLEQIQSLVNDRSQSPQHRLQRIKILAKRDAQMLTEILNDYLRLNQDDQTYRKARIRAARRMLGEN